MEANHVNIIGESISKRVDTQEEATAEIVDLTVKLLRGMDICPHCFVREFVIEIESDALKALQNVELDSKSAKEIANLLRVFTHGNIKVETD